MESDTKASCRPVACPRHRSPSLLHACRLPCAVLSVQPQPSLTTPAGTRQGACVKHRPPRKAGLDFWGRSSFNFGVRWWVFVLRRAVYRVAQKTGTLRFVRLDFIKYWPIFKLNSLSELWIRRTFVIILSLKIPPRLKCVAILPCEI